MKFDKKAKLNLMGRRVTVSKIFKRTYKTNERVWEVSDIESRPGWIVGFRHIYNGTYSSGGNYGGYDEPPEYEPPYLAVDKAVPCVLVSFTPYKNPERVPLDAFTLGGEEPDFREYKWPNNGAKEELSHLMKDAPRDEKGRWEKENATV